MKVAAIVLAAGGSLRLGEPKQLLALEGQPLVRRAAAAALDAKCAPVAVVVGNDREAIAAALADLPLTIVSNDFWERGIGSSIRAGLEALPDCDSVVILACDQPSVDREVIRRLVVAREKTGHPIVASAYSGALGVPALFGHEFFNALRSLPDARGAKSIIAAHPEQVAAVPFAEGVFDIDTPQDLRHLRPGKSLAK